MSKQLIIDKCDDCPFFDNEYYGYDETCTKLDRVIKSNKNYTYDIPSDCPLIEVSGDIESDS